MDDLVPTPDPLMSLTEWEINTIFQKDIAQQEMMDDYARRHPEHQATDSLDKA